MTKKYSSLNEIKGLEEKLKECPKKFQHIDKLNDFKYGISGMVINPNPGHLLHYRFGPNIANKFLVILSHKKFLSIYIAPVQFPDEIPEYFNMKGEIRRVGFRDIFYMKRKKIVGGGEYYIDDPDLDLTLDSSSDTYGSIPNSVAKVFAELTRLRLEKLIRKKKWGIEIKGTYVDTTASCCRSLIEYKYLNQFWKDLGFTEE